MKPLTVGNVVSAGFRIYRDRFLEYFRIAFIGYLWVLVPIYGWAKFAAMNGLIARLAFGEVTEKPETEKEARRYIKPRMWQFLGADILFWLILLFGFLFCSFVLGFVSFIVGLVIGLDRNNVDPSTLAFLGLFFVISIILLIIAMIWLISRYLMIELPLAVEDGINAGAALGRSWNLTKGSVIRLQMIVFVAFLISVPISIVIQVASIILQLAMGSLASIANDLVSSFFSFFFTLMILAISLAGGALLIPFWQAIKAVIYYDLRVRREGFGIELEENN